MMKPESKMPHYVTELSILPPSPPTGRPKAHPKKQAPVHHTQIYLNSNLRSLVINIHGGPKAVHFSTRRIFGAVQDKLKRTEHFGKIRFVLS